MLHLKKNFLIHYAIKIKINIIIYIKFFGNFVNIHKINKYYNYKYVCFNIST